MARSPPEVPAARPVTGATGLLKVLLALSVLVPVVLFAIVAWLTWRAHMADAEASLVRLSEVAREQASKVFDSQRQVADRVTDLVRNLSVPEIRRSEQSLHEAFARIVARLPQVQSVLLVAEDGHPLVSAGTYPVPQDVDLSNHDYFQAVRGGFAGVYVSRLQVGDVNHTLFFGLSQPWVGGDGAVLGVIDVAVLPGFFQDFYKVLVDEGGGGAAGEVVTLIRADGQILVRYPPIIGAAPVAPPDGPFARAIRSSPVAGTYMANSLVDTDSPERLFSYRKVADYPVYAVAGRSRSAIVAEWRQAMASQLAFGLPVTLALIGVTWTALVRARREEEALRLAQQEIARREVAEAALLRSQRLEAVGQMTGGVAHDFNNLLTIILGSAEMIDRRAEDPARVRSIARQILLAARRGGEVTQQLLAFSRRQVVRPEIIHLNQRLREFHQLFERAARETVEIELDLAATDDAVRLDPGQFESAVLNLIGNARDAMPQGGRIVVSTRTVAVDNHQDLPQGAYVRVAVGDTGSGMDAQTVARAFEPFFTTKEIGQGTGLGLSQVYGFVKQAGGDVRIVSAPGQGTTVELLLPRTDVAAGSASPHHGGAPHEASGGEVVLVVEDEPGLLAMTAESLRELGYVTHAAQSGPAALEHLRAGLRVDLLFSDVVLRGGMTGIDLAHEARRLRPGLKVLLTSGYTSELSVTADPDLPLLNKPYDRGQLAERLRDVLAA
jgi:two-component system NtrC family sensor kinase